MRVALDTNVLVSAVATRGLCADLFSLILAENQLIVGQTVLAELKKVLRQKFRLPGDLIEEYEALLHGEAIIAEKTSALKIDIRDRSDIPVLSEAVASGADVLVTGDTDLIEVADHAPIRILTPRGFWELLSQRNP